MPESKTSFVGVTVGLVAIAFVVGFFMALVSVGDSGVLYRVALRWELMKAIIAVAAWAPAILLSASALSLESSEASDGFAGTASKLLVPALVMAAAVSLFYLLVVPAVEKRRELYETQGRYFARSLEQAREALSAGDLNLTAKLLVDCEAIDGADERVIELNSRLAIAKARSEDAAARAERRPSSQAGPETGSTWDKANAFYLDALRAKSEGRLFDAHYLAKRSAEMYPKRPEVTRLVEETWAMLERTPRSAESKEAEAFYRRKLEGYARFQERDFLAAYSIFVELEARDPSDRDVPVYLEESAAGLETVAFFVEEAERAFSRSAGRPLSLTMPGPDGSTYALKAEKAAAAEDAVYLSGVTLEKSAPDGYRAASAFARLHGDNLTVRAVDRNKPERVFEPRYSDGESPSSPYVIVAPFSQADAASMLALGGKPSDIPIAALAQGVSEARRLGTPIQPLLIELASRTAYPFSVVMLTLFGAALGIRFKPKKAPKPLGIYLSAPILVALAIPPLQVTESLGILAARTLAAIAPPEAFVPTWLGFLGICVVVVLFVSAGVAGRPRHR